MFVRGVIVGNGMDDFAGGDGAFHGVEELDEFLVSMLWHAASDHGPVENILRAANNVVVPLRL